MWILVLRCRLTAVVEFRLLCWMVLCSRFLVGGCRLCLMSSFGGCCRFCPECRGLLVRLARLREHRRLLVVDCVMNE